MTWITTRTGRQFPLLNPTPADVDLDDLEALSMLCRFGGHVRAFYSVAQHSFACRRATRTT